MKKILSIMFILLSFTSYSKFEKQFELTLFEESTGIKSYINKNESLVLGILNIKETKEKSKVKEIKSLSNSEFFMMVMESMNGKILEATNNMILIKSEESIMGGYAMGILNNSEIFMIEGKKYNDFENALRYLKLNSKISEINERNYNLLTLKIIM